MIDRFEFATAGRIVFGRGTAHDTANIAAAYGSRFLIVRGSSPERAQEVFDRPAALKLGIPHEPTIDWVRTAVSAARDSGCDVVVAIGGGSVIDAGKAIAALIPNTGDVLDYLEVIGAGRPLKSTPSPLIAVPTTAGTGSEVTRNAVLGSPQHKTKASLRHPAMLPRVAIIDPELTLSLPPAITASTGLDALTQLIEPYVSIKANALTDGFCLAGLQRARALRQSFTNGADIEARESMSFASLMGGLALANAGLGVVHGFAAAIGGAYDAPHGAVCAALLPHAMRANIAAARSSAQHRVIERFTTIAQILTGAQNATAEQGAEWVQRLVENLQIPSLANYGIRAEEHTGLLDVASRANSTKGNPVPLSHEQLSEILSAAL